MQVMTVTGPLPAEEMGVTDAHDHLFLRSPLLAGEEIEDPAAVAAEVRDGARSGIATIVELTPIGLGRRPEALRALALETGVHIIGATGFHRDAHYPLGHPVLTASDDTLLAWMTTDLAQGMHPTDWSDRSLPVDAARAGVIKTGASLDEITANERRRFVAAANAAIAAGVAVVVHCEAATLGEEIADLLISQGLPAGQIILAHMDRDPDPRRHGELLARGLFLVYDTIGRVQYHPDIVRLDLIAAVCAAGRGGQILLGLDLGKRSYLGVAGGHGLRYLMDDFVPRLRERVGIGATQKMLVDNAATAFALRSPVAA
ncbi:MAG: 5-phospho-D-xylono,4-lactonase [Chloroflexota bacterium]|jgi:phosphotriesterase-related protein|nr:5-phospho-D-xylono,4-lactonase [Chloroflexota bacterium]